MGTTSGPPPPSLLSSAALCYLQASWSSSQMAWCCPCIVPTTKSLVRFIWCVALSFLIADTSDMSLVTAQALRDAKVWISQTKHTGPLCVHCHGRSCRAVPTISLPKGCCHCKGHTTDFMGEGSSSPSQEGLTDLHEPVMNDGCCPLLARKGKCCLDYFDVRDESWEFLILHHQESIPNTENN